MGVVVVGALDVSSGADHRDDRDDGAGDAPAQDDQRAEGGDLERWGHGGLQGQGVPDDVGEDQRPDSSGPPEQPRQDQRQADTAEGTDAPQRHVQGGAGGGRCEDGVDGDGASSYRVGR